MKKVKKELKCCVSGCARKKIIKSHGLCKSHYMRYWRTGIVGGLIRAKKAMKVYKSEK